MEWTCQSDHVGFACAGSNPSVHALLFWPLTTWNLCIFSKSRNYVMDCGEVPWLSQIEICTNYFSFWILIMLQIFTAVKTSLKPMTLTCRKVYHLQGKSCQRTTKVLLVTFRAWHAVGHTARVIKHDRNIMLALPTQMLFKFQVAVTESQ